MTQYVSNPSGVGTASGWTKTSGTLVGTADGARWQTSGGEIQVPAGRPSAGVIRLIGLQIRRNTASSKWPAKVFLWSEGRIAGMQVDLTDVDFPVGKFVTIPTLSVDHYIHEIGGTTYDKATVYILGPESGSLDCTITHVAVYDDSSNDAVIDASDTAFTYTSNPNTLTQSFSRIPGDEAVAAVKWTWGDGTTTSGPAAGSGQVSQARAKAFPSPGIYTVKLECTMPPRSKHASGGEPNVPIPAATTVSSTRSVTVPVGPLAASFVAETDYLNLIVDGSESYAPSLSPLDTWAWSWGDGTTKAASSSPFAEHTYSQAGSYNVTLTVRDAATNRSATMTKTVTVAAAPNPDNYFVAHQELLVVDFTPSITDGTSYSWSFGDGTPVSTQTAPTHTYAAPGTYTVTLTVNGNLTTSQQIVVADRYQLLGNLIEALRLEVAVRHPAGTIYNRLSNPSGELGAFGWSTPVTNSYMVGSSTANTPGDKGIAGAKLIYRSSGAGTQVAYSEPVRVVPGQYVSAQWQAPYVDGFHRATVEALDAAGAVLGSSATTGYLSGSQTATPRTTPYLLPAGTVTARVRVNHYSTTSAGTPAVGKILQLRRVMLATAPTSAELTANPYLEGVDWHDLLGPTASIEWTRGDLNLGTFSATILDSSYDPARSGVIRPGQKIRLRVATADAFGNVAYESLFSGTVDDTPVTYVQRKGRGEAGPKSTRITITATDAIKTLAGTGRAGGVSKISELPQLLEGIGVPFEVNGSSGQVPAAQIVSVNDNASALDQIAVARDSSGGYAFVNRNNVLTARDPEHMPTVPAGVIDERAYSSIDASFNTSECINSVTIKWLRNSGSQAEEVTYGPYVAQASVDEWGLRPATFTMHGVENPTAIAARGAAILAANAQPRRRINSVRLPIRYVEDLTPGKALLDIYDLVRLGYARTETDELARVTSIKHTVTPKRWTMDLGFAADGAVASPQVIPSPSPAKAGGWVDLTPGDSSWSPYGGSYTRPQFKVFAGRIHLRGLMTTTASRASSSTVATLSASFAPLRTELFPAVTSVGTLRLDVTAAGALNIFASGAATIAAGGFVSLSGISWEYGV